jgi:hypothetical protein
MQWPKWLIEVGKFVWFMISGEWKEPLRQRPIVHIHEVDTEDVPPPEPEPVAPVVDDKRARQLAWQKQIQDAMDGRASAGSALGGLTATALIETYLPEGVKLKPPGSLEGTFPATPALIDSSCIEHINDGGRRDRSDFPAYMIKLRDEALQTPRGRFVRAKQDAAEAYAKELGINLEILVPIVEQARKLGLDEPSRIANELSPYHRRIDATLVGDARRGSIREKPPARPDPTKQKPA